jgi:hypothetical protein
MSVKQIPLEGFYHHTPDDEMVRNSFVEITLPEPPPKRSGKSRVVRVMRWKVSLLAPVSLGMKGVCSTLGFKDYMFEAAKTLASRTKIKDPAYACYYGLVDMRGRPIHPRSRPEVAREIDVGDWPDFRQCSCPDCVARFGGEKEPGVVILPPIESLPTREERLPFRAIPVPNPDEVPAIVRWRNLEPRYAEVPVIESQKEKEK